MKSYNYKDKVRSRRRERRNAKHTGKNPNKNLAFFTQIIHDLGYSMASFARAIGTSQQNIYHFLINDDITLSELQEWFTRLGLKITATFEGIKPLPIESDVPTIIWGPDVLPVGKKTNLDAQVRLLASSSSRIAFVAQLIIDSKHGVHAFYTRLRVPRTTFMSWLDRGDVRISALYRMAEITSTKLVWRIDSIQ